ncbi:universal stress protein [Roseobacter sp. GAI101]|uniref:universal stress protein n=1 Tax=Roseobacter sp. (strain GAI101) TaxID=391589 RepID=UPI0034A0B560
MSRERPCSIVIKVCDRTIVTGKAGVRIPAVASEFGAGLIIQGAFHPGAVDYSLGSMASRVARRAACSVIYPSAKCVRQIIGPRPLKGHQL